MAIHLEAWHDLEDKVVLVTGASSGIGRELCLDLARAGCKIIAAARRIDRLKFLCDEINQLLPIPKPDQEGLRAKALELDIAADGSVIEKRAKMAWDLFGRIDVLINNAGGPGELKSPLDFSEEEWNRTFKINLTGSWLLSKYVSILMREAGQGGSVINISSISGLNRGYATRNLTYITSKAALNTMTKVMALELGKHKIRVNSIAPGLFKSEITEGLMQKDWLTNVAQRIVPLRTFGTLHPALTSLIRYLIHDSSEYISGNIFIVDSGTSLPGVPIFSSL
ncbi:hypothetical protein ACFE04_030083 [Oxalis oulophora]